MVNGMHINKKMLIQYDSIEYGSNITYRKVDGIKEIDLSRMKY